MAALSRRFALGLWLLAAGCVHGREEEPVEGKPIAEGRVSFYGEDFRGRLTASGTKFDPDGMTAAHKTLPFGTCLIVENLENGRRVRVSVNDRGPYAPGRILDVSLGAAKALKMLQHGVVTARLWPCRDAR